MHRLILLVIWTSYIGRSQENSLMEVNITIGETQITIYEHKSFDADSIIFLNVHEDEVTSIETLQAYQKRDSIRYFYLKHQQTRRIFFKLRGKDYDVDPNRIFTRKGRRKTLKDGNRNSFWANREVRKLSKEIIARIPENHTVVAVHNNTDTNYSIKSYLPDGDEAQNTADIYINPQMDPDDFIYTTDRTFYEAFKARKVNVILQDNQGYVNDGSLSVYCGKRGIPYINIETQRGHFEEQMALMEVTLDVIRKSKSLDL